MQYRILVIISYPCLANLTAATVTKAKGRKATQKTGRSSS
jgi:hypothetical protein